LIYPQPEPHVPHHPSSEQDQPPEPQPIILTNIDLISSSSGVIHSKIVSLKSIVSSSIMSAGDSFIHISVFNESSFVISSSIKSTSQSSSKQFFTLM